jgi:hypothetical protein
MTELGLNDRATDIWKPLFAVATVFGDEQMCEQLRALAQEMSPDAERQDEVRQLRVAAALRTLAGPGGTITGTTQQVIDRLRKVTDAECPDLHAVLSGWHFKEKSIRLPEFDTPRKAWEFTDDMLVAVEQRLTPGMATTTTTKPLSGRVRIPGPHRTGSEERAL